MLSMYPQGGPDGKALLFGFIGVLPLLPKIIFSLAFVLFFLGVIHLFIAPLDFVPGFDKLDREKKSQSLAYMILALFIMFSIYGIIAMISQTTGIGIGPSSMPVPNLPLDR